MSSTPCLIRQGRAAFFAGGRALLGRLEDELHRPRQLIAQAAQDLGHAELDGHVDVMPAGVFHPGILRFVRDVVDLGDRERIHVGADSHNRAWLAALEQRHDPVPAYAGLDVVEAQSPQFFGHDTGGTLFAVRQFGMHVEVAPLLDQLVAQGFGDLGDALLGGLRGRRQRQRKGYQEDAKAHFVIVDRWDKLSAGCGV